MGDIASLTGTLSLDRRLIHPARELIAAGSGLPDAILSEAYVDREGALWLAMEGPIVHRRERARHGLRHPRRRARRRGRRGLMALQIGASSGYAPQDCLSPWRCLSRSREKSRTRSA
jgi:hypothetical protein